MFAWMFYSINFISNTIITKSQIRKEKKNSFEYFHKYDEISLSFHILRLKINMFIMFFRNIRFSIMCNDIRAKFTRVTFYVLKIEMISNKSINEKILIFRISLNSKNDEINKKRKKIVSCQFIKRQFFMSRCQFQKKFEILIEWRIY